MQTIHLKFNNKIYEVGGYDTNPIKLLFKSIRGLFFILLLGLPLAFLGGNIYNEEFLFGAYSFLVLVGVGLFISILLYKGKNLLIDPPSLVNVLVFALLTIIPTVFSTSISAANTFGIPGIRNIAGLSIILFIITFYLIHSTNLPGKIWLWISKVASIVNVTILANLVLNESLLNSNTNVLSTVLSSTAISIGVVVLVNLLISLRFGTERVKMFNVGIALVTLLVSVIQLNPVLIKTSVVINEFLFMLSVVIGLIFSLLIYKAWKRVGLDNLKKEVRNSIKLKLYLSVAAISIVVLAYTLLSYGMPQFSFLTRISDFFATADLTQMFFGKGLLTALTASGSTFYTLLSGFGVVGLFGHLYLFGYIFNKEYKKRDLKNILVLIIIAIGSLFSNVNLYLSLIILFILVKDAPINTITLNAEVVTTKKWLRWSRKILAAFAIVLFGVIAVSLLKFVGIIV